MLPLVGQPLVELAHGRGREVGQQLREVQLRIDGMASAGAGEAGQDGGRAAALFVADEQGVFSIQYDAFHLPFAHVVVDGHGPVFGKDIQFLPLVERVLDRQRHRMSGQKLIGILQEESRRLGEPQETDGPQHPRRILHQNVGYFSKHRRHMDYPGFRARGWPIASGDTEAAVKQFNKRIKGTGQFWTEQGVETIMALRSLWTSQDQRWQHHWQNRPAYVN